MATSPRLLLQIILALALALSLALSHASVANSSACPASTEVRCSGEEPRPPPIQRFWGEETYHAPGSFLEVTAPPTAWFILDDPCAKCAVGFARDDPCALCAAGTSQLSFDLAERLVARW